MLGFQDVCVSARAAPAVGTLPPQLLALVLARLPQAERLGTCALVSKAWRAAAVMVTTSISFSICIYTQRSRSSSQEYCQACCTALSAWLQAHAATAAIDSMSVQVYPYYGVHNLQLPAQQLAALRSLDLQSVAVAAQGAAGTQQAAAEAVAPDLPAALSGLTHLRLWHCVVGLGTMPAFTKLQHLALSGCLPPGSTQVTALAAALSGLQQLAHLQLGDDYAHDAILACVHSLPSLRELLLQGQKFTDAGLAALPGTLTKLRLGPNPYDPDEDGGDDMNADLGPSLTQLTGLQCLEAVRVVHFDPEFVRGMRGLRRLVVLHTPMLEAALEGGGAWDDMGLSVLRELTQLQHFHMDPDHNNDLPTLDPTAADIAAFTAPSQLTYLRLGKALVGQRNDAALMFPEGRQLPQLRKLWASMTLLTTAEGARALVRCCPRLESIDLSAAWAGETPNGVDGSSVGMLRHLQGLTSLELDVAEHACSPAFWDGLACLTQLRHLSLHSLGMARFARVVCLSSCRQLTCLWASSHTWGRSYYFRMQTPEGQEPDIWRRLPHEALQEASRHYELARTQGWDGQWTLQTMFEAAASHWLALDLEAAQLRAEVAELRATVASLEGRQQQQEDRQQREVADLRATVAAMGAQLQAVLQLGGAQRG